MAAVPSATQRRILGDDLADALINSFDPVNDPGSDVESDLESTDDSFENEIVFTRSDAQQQWDENMRTLEEAVFHVLCPVLGRLFGRRFAQNMWVRFVDYRWRVSHPE